SAERAIEKIAHELALRLILGVRRLVDMRPLGLVAAHQPLLGHDLQQLEHGRVAGLAAERFGHLPDGAGPARPQYAQNRELGVGRFPEARRHWRIIYDSLRRCQYEALRRSENAPQTLPRTEDAQYTS